MLKNKFSTYLLLFVMIMSLMLSVGCGKDNNSDNSQKGDDGSKDVIDKDDQNKQEEETTPEKKVVKLLKRNGVEWKENTTINSQQGDEKYTVVWGDTLSLIARAWNVNCYRLARYNNIENIDLIEVGQVIYNYTYNR